MILFLNIVSAVQIGISPPQIEFEGKTEEKICRTITLFSEQEEKFIGIDKWVIEKNFVKDINKYNTTSSALGINFYYPKELIVKEKSEIKVCIEGVDSGDYYGAIIYSTNKSVAIGSWISLKVYGSKKNLQNKTKETIFITSRTIEENNGDKKLFLYLNSVLTIILAYFLIVLLKSKES
ncbi:hypothetical protein J4225_01895 [Candidatus Pacearchaeota archaeon]|nr:hypothetical protein [Candidatus Pacearchaeota archaeon]